MNRVVAPPAGCVLAGAASMLVACSGEESGPPAVSSFHYVETVTGKIDGDPIDSREEGWYQAPDLARIVTNVSYSALGLENIVIGTQVWERRNSGWSGSTTDVDCFNALVSIKGILAYSGIHDDSVAGVDGPIVGGEPTRRYKWTSEDAGRLLISSLERSLGDSPSEREVLARTKEIFSNLTGRTEIVVGKSTGRVYSVVATKDGPKLSDRRETIVDQHDEPVDIKPPPNVPPSAEDQRSGASCRSDFPWIPGATAAILGPLLFLLGSAFLWPRRL